MCGRWVVIGGFGNRGFVSDGKKKKGGERRRAFGGLVCVWVVIGVFGGRGSSLDLTGLDNAASGFGPAESAAAVLQERTGFVVGGWLLLYIPTPRCWT